MALPGRFVQEDYLLRKRRLLVFGRLTRGEIPRVLGHGAFSTAFALGRSQVLKITDARDETSTWFTSWCLGHPNPHWPRFYRQVQLGRNHVATWMERLYPLDHTSEERVSAVDDFILNAASDSAAYLEGLAEHGYGGKWQKCPKRLRQPLLDCRLAAERAGFVPDRKRSVFMRRLGGILVLADPFQVAPLHRLRSRTKLVQGG